jgi:hypothetical protein
LEKRRGLQPRHTSSSPVTTHTPQEEAP